MFGKSNPVKTGSTLDSAAIVQAAINSRVRKRVIRGMTPGDLPSINSLYINDLLLGFFRRFQTINLP